MNRDIDATEVEDYYEKNHFVYDIPWSLDSPRGAIHVGYFDEDHTSLGQAVENMKRKICEQVDIGPDDRVLDAGCGLGETTTWIAKNRGAEVVGLNITRKHIERAREIAAERGVEDRASFRYDDFTEMETVEDDSFDVVWGLESICYANDKRDFLEQAERVLKDGGRLVVADAYMTERDLSESDSKVMQKWLEGWKLPNFAHVDDFTGAMGELGFDDVEVHDATENVTPSSKGMWRRGIIGYPFAKALSLIGVFSDEQVGNLVACYYQRKAFQRDLVDYCIVSGRK